MNDKKNIEYFPPHPLLKSIVQYVVGIVGGALATLLFFGFAIRKGVPNVEEQFQFLLVAIALTGGIFGGWMVFLTKLEKRRDEKKSQ